MSPLKKRVLCIQTKKTTRTRTRTRTRTMQVSQYHEDFPDRLGYACLNTVLRKSKPSVFCSRTARIGTIATFDEDDPGKGVEYLQKLGLRNIEDLERMILWNERHGIRFFRMSSDMFPFASHEKYGYSLSYCSAKLARVGELARRFSHRLTTHPGQTNNLGSPNPNVVRSTRRDLMYHAEMLDLLHLDKDSVMVIHGGGVYNDKSAALARWEKEYLLLPENVRNRLVIENDEFSFSCEDLLPLCEKLGIPLVFDWHHHALNPGSIGGRGSDSEKELLARIKKTWTDKGVKQKMHFSESREGVSVNASITARRAHSDYVKTIPMCGKDVDLMIEAKMKEQAVFRVLEWFVDKKEEASLPSS
jgi:UV DNA damage endonuclease